MLATNLVLCLFACFSQVRVSLQADTYKALVVEYYPRQVLHLTPEERAELNANEYIDLLKDNENVDIIVFPEGTITSGALETRPNLAVMSTAVPLEKNPCDDTDDIFPNFFKTLSCGAKNKDSYMVVNIIEKAVCSEEAEDGDDCAPDDFNFYNTNVAFNRTGGIIAKYRKYHLFGEYAMNVTKNPEQVTFETDFDVTFGMFTCFDILFELPALGLVRKGVRHMIFPSMWFGGLPFLTALQTQHMWAVEHDVVLLAAGANNPRQGSGGTGIFQGNQGALGMGVVSEYGSEVFVKDVKKNWGEGNTIASGSRPTEEIDETGAAMDNFSLIVDNLMSYESLLLDLSAGTIDVNLCHGDFCCDFHVTAFVVTQPESYHYQYRLVAFSGTRSFSGVYNGGIDVCALISCLNSTLESCGMRHQPYSEITWPYIFDEVVISGTFKLSTNTTQMPNTLLSDVKPMDVGEYTWSGTTSTDDKTIERKLTLEVPQARLMTFGIYGRDFGRERAPSAGNSIFATMAALIWVAASTVVAMS